MNKKLRRILLWSTPFACAGLLQIGFSTVNGAEKKQKDDSAYELEKQKALKNPYANDFGPEKIDVSSYLKEMQTTYRTLLVPKCGRCHTPARPLNSQFWNPRPRRGNGKPSWPNGKIHNRNFFPIHWCGNRKQKSGTAMSSA